MNASAVQYWPLALFFAVTLLFGIMTLTIGALFRPRNPQAAKSLPYECGIEPVGEANPSILPRYYFYAILLVVFDVEVVFLVPWALNAVTLGWAGFAAVVAFFAVLMAGYLYIWRKGDLNWE